MSQNKSDHRKINIPKNWNHDFTSKEKAIDVQFLLAVSWTFWLLRKIFKLNIESELREIVRNLIGRSIKNRHLTKDLWRISNFFFKQRTLVICLHFIRNIRNFANCFKMKNFSCSFSTCSDWYTINKIIWLLFQTRTLNLIYEWFSTNNVNSN